MIFAGHELGEEAFAERESVQDEQVNFSDKSHEHWKVSVHIGGVSL